MSYYKYTRAQWNALPWDGDPAVRERIWQSISKRLKFNKTRRIFLQSFAAVSFAAAAIAASVLIGRHSVPANIIPVEHYSTVLAASNQANILPDGSEVWLESGSRILYDDTFGSCRKVVLEGSASFDIVKKEDGSTFEVDLGDASVIVYGTTFSITQNNPDETVVTLYEGAVNFVTEDRSVPLEPGSSLTWNRKSSTVSTRPFFDGITWQDGRFKLENATLTSLVDFIRWRYDVEVYVSPRVAKSTTKLTGLVGGDESVDSVIDKVCYVMGLTSKREGESFRLYKQ